MYCSASNKLISADDLGDEGMLLIKKMLPADDTVFIVRNTSILNIHHFITAFCTNHNTENTLIKQVPVSTIEISG